MTVATYNHQPQPAHYGSPTLRPMARRSYSQNTSMSISRSAAPLPGQRTRAKPAPPSTKRRPPRKHIWVVVGPAGSGKTTVAEHLAEKLRLQYVEGDDFHSEAAVHKMKVLHQPLTDADRWDWLINIREHALNICRGLDPEAPMPANPYPRSKASSPQPECHGSDPSPHDTPAELAPGPVRVEASSISSATNPPDFHTDAGAVVTCSALKARYRDEFRIAALPTHTSHEFDLRVYFIYLSLDERELRRRVRARKNHYMSEEMVASQVASLETPNDVEVREDVVHVDASGSEADVMRLVLEGVARKRAKEEREELEDEEREAASHP